ncbi:MAG TPA: right-handed parallel beta-helix repeat-containing protein [Bryobacteraceae bacterium]|nr:right-handed parallel beta-helix repeat-containing protein [Bryobacteraceae bacterium]
MKRRSFLTSGLAAAAVAAAPGGPASGAAEFYVAPDGRDENPGNKPKPFATLQRARDEVRKVIAAGLKANVTVWIRGGTYTLRDTLVFGPEDSGTDQCSITYQAVPGEEPILTSGVEIEGWKRPDTMLGDLPVPAEGNVWVADVPESLGRFCTLYDQQGHLGRAQGNAFVPGDPPAGADGTDRAGRLRNLYYPAGAIRNWTNLDDVEIVIRYSSTMNILALESVDETALVARTSLPGTYPLRKLQPKQRTPSAWVENVLEVLDHPGAWVLNTHTRKLYLWPRGEAPKGIVAPRLRELIRIEGKNDAAGSADVPVRNLVFRGLTFAHADRDVWSRDDIGIQHDWEMVDKPDALVRLRGAEKCTVQNCRFRDSGGTAIRLDLYAQKNRIEGNEIRYMGQGGIMLIGYGPGMKDVNQQNEILNNHIHNCGLIYWHSVGLMLWQSGGNHVANNYIHHMPRHAISLSGVRVPYFEQRCGSREICGSLRWQEIGERKTWNEVMPFLHTRNNLVEHNEVERVLQKLGDGAGINVTGAGEGNIIRRNYVHDIFASEWVSGCLRTDDWQRGTTWEENVIYRSNAGAWEHKGGNSVINNYAIDVLPRGYFRIFRDGPGEKIDGTVLERNIFYSSNGAAVFYTFAVGPQQVAKSKIEHNLYYCGGVEETSTPKFLQTLRAQGVSATDVYADPMFVALQPGNFRLKPESPALKMGIKQIDLNSVGLTKAFPKWLLG